MFNFYSQYLYVIFHGGGFMIARLRLININLMLISNEQRELFIFITNNVVIKLLYRVIL